jgi:hypothetical protein
VSRWIFCYTPQCRSFASGEVRASSAAKLKRASGAAHAKYPATARSAVSSVCPVRHVLELARQFANLSAPHGVDPGCEIAGAKAPHGFRQLVQRRGKLESQHPTEQHDGA